jgi:hypothetical protein
MLHSLARTILAFWWLISSAQPFFAQSADPANPNARYNLEGTVVNAQTGRPIAHALVEIYGAKAAMLTDAEGHFTFEKMPRGSFLVSVRKPGFNAPGATEYNPSLSSVTLGPNANKLELRLVPEAGFVGEVTDSDGEPMEGSSVQVSVVKFLEGRRQMMPVGRGARTDEDGSFHMAGLTAGRYYLSVRPGAGPRRLLGTQSQESTTSLPAILYFPAAPDLAAATPIDLAPGQREHVTFTLKRGPAFKLAGVITGVAAYKQAGPPMIVDDFGQQLFSAQRWDNQAGTFEFPPIPPGKYNLQMYAVNEDRRPAWLRETITLDRNVTDLSLALEPGLSIAIVVNDELSPSRNSSYCSGIVGAMDGATGDCSKITVNVSLMSADGWPTQVGAQPVSAADPSLMLNRVMPGKYIVRVVPMVAGHVHSLRSGSVDLLSEQLVVPARGHVPPIEVVLRDDGGRVKVRVRSDKLPTSARLLVFPEFAPNLPPTNLDILPSGEREWGDLPPGSYKIFAFDSIDGLEYGNPEVMAKYLSKAATVTITSNGNATATVDLIHTGE